MEREQLHREKQLREEAQKEKEELQQRVQELQEQFHAAQEAMVCRLLYVALLGYWPAIIATSAHQSILSISLRAE